MNFQCRVQRVSRGGALAQAQSTDPSRFKLFSTFKYPK
ncbi:hypothetical protein SLEP1_g26322 [Rubroshorea leprosula]|uniref:Uncharacterized protein n=1 Tax=Rubroshorea leprosula TaxID=152421 RepID=A0AAV5JXV5_9ROSI|nr:hypothetical protein SLEP1_g26322 [Rubroshorea leprosula]